MKTVLMRLGIIVLASFGTAIAQNTPQEKPIVLTLTKGEVELIYSVVDDAPIDGKLRKPLLQKIAQQYQIQTDTTNRKK